MSPALDLGAPRRRRRISLTPMIDVVFLLLVFFMLAARFGVDRALPLGAAGGGGYSGPPRLVTIGADGLSLNGAGVSLAALPGRLRQLTRGPEDVILLRPRGEAETADLARVVDRLRAAGFTALALAE